MIEKLDLDRHAAIDRRPYLSDKRWFRLGPLQKSAVTAENFFARVACKPRERIIHEDDWVVWLMRVDNQHWHAGRPNGGREGVSGSTVPR